MSAFGAVTDVDFERARKRRREADEGALTAAFHSRGELLFLLF